MEARPASKFLFPFLMLANELRNITIDEVPARIILPTSVSVIAPKLRLFSEINQKARAAAEPLIVKYTQLEINLNICPIREYLLSSSAKAEMHPTKKVIAYKYIV
jgi:hypothetical protein